MSYFFYPSIGRKQIGATGLEPVSKKTQLKRNKELTEKPKTADDQKLPKDCNPCAFSIAQNDIDLQQIITAWLKLPENIKAVVKAWVQKRVEEET